VGGGRVPVRDAVGAPPDVVLGDERRGIGVDQADPLLGTDVVGGRGPVGWTGFFPKMSPQNIVYVAKILPPQAKRETYAK